MPTVFVPPQLRRLTGDIQQIGIEARTVREAVQALEQKFPGVQERLLQDDNLRPGLSVSVDGKVSGLGLYQKVLPDSEIHFIPAIGGG
jgi:sulfur-carrier protein